MYIVPMADEWEDPATEVLLGTMQVGKDWSTSPSTAPDEVVDEICNMMDS